MNTFLRRCLTSILVLAFAVSSAIGSPELLFPFVASGEGVSARIILTNVLPAETSGTIHFFDLAGQKAPLSVNGSAESVVRYEIPGGGAFQMETDGKEDL